MKRILLLFFLLLIVSCMQNDKTFKTSKNDYDKFLSTKAAKTTSKYFELWNSKIQPDSIQLTSFGIVAGEYNRYFNNTGKIEYLKKAEQALTRAVEIAAIGKSNYYRALARNYISQHRFKEALQLADSARAKGSGVTESQSLLFDVHMELGNYEQAEKYLDSVKNMSSFGYLIRLAKWNDHKGDLDTTIKFMEKAREKAESSKMTSLLLWSYTNLADYYGHAGRIEESYQHFLKALELDPQNAYAKKGIAWIVFSYEKNPEEALRILDSVTKTYKAPDYYLLKAEIAGYMGDDKEQLNNLDLYYKTVSDPRYGAMYNVYNAGLYLDQTHQYNRALQLAKEEVKNRPTPETYGLLAYAYYKDGQLDEALHIAQNEILGKTYEPGVLLYVAEIYKASGRYMEEVAQLRSELMGSVYELGPSAEDKIKDL